jgi:hypothetical protein
MVPSFALKGSLRSTALIGRTSRGYFDLNEWGLGSSPQTTEQIFPKLVEKTKLESGNECLQHHHASRYTDREAMGISDPGGLRRAVDYFRTQQL